MADQAVSNSTVSIFMDDIRSSLGGVYNYAPKDTADKWIFAEIAVSNSSSDLIAALDFLGSVTTITTSDKPRWLAIKNISTTATDGISICLDADTAAWNLGDAIAIGAGELLILKPVAATINDIHAISVTMDGTYGYPTGTHSGSVSVQVAAILEDVA